MRNEQKFKIDCPLLLADTEEEQIKGLSGRNDLGNYCGMRFVFHNAQVRTFWNKDTLLNLKLYWLRNGREIGTVCLPAESVRGTIRVTSPGPVDEVIEMVDDSCV